ncbi:hypothetical protein MJO29_010170 [Puccinia striiformis f. sp. tritici]|nr:hypothetical protein MJO29_010170 [Puccinia striiformis f. sp. tritici]
MAYLMAPTVHLNYAYFEILDSAHTPNNKDSKPKLWCFGGGTDLTLSYIFEEYLVALLNSYTQKQSKEYLAYLTQVQAA